LSIIVAVTKRKRTVVAADTLFLTGGQKDYSETLVGRSKVRPIGDSLLGVTGWSIYQNIIDHYITRQRNVTLKDERAVFNFFLKFWKSLRQQYPFIKEQREGSDSPFTDLDSSFLVANRHGIFDVHGNMTVWRHKEYCAIGSGSQYAYGALHALYNRIDSPEEIAVLATESAVRFDDGCDGPIETFAVK